LIQRIEQNIRNRHLLKRGQALLVAVSGGLDSMVLLNVLHALSARHRWKLTVAHFNHQLRGQSSDADERLVRQTAGLLKLPFVAGRADVVQFAQKSKLSVEMAARKLRHEFFARMARDRRISVVALAHHADDQVELFFLRALRGAGSEGLAGMKWRSPSPVDKKLVLIRPQLEATKADLSAFARENKIRFREDATNASLDLPRNRIRHELLPLLHRRYQPALTKTIRRLMDIVGAEAEFVSKSAKQWLCRRRGDESQIGTGKQKRKMLETPCIVSCNFKKLPVAVQRRVLQVQLADLGIATDFELVEQLRRSPDVFVSVRRNFSVARTETGKLNFRSQPTAGFKADELKVNLNAGAGEVDFNGVRFQWALATGTKPARLRQFAGREIFDADKVGGQIILRHWRAGDRFQPIGMKSAVKLQDLFTNQKTPRAQRRELIVAESAVGGIFWVQNLRMAERFKLTLKTRRRLIWHWQCHSR